MSELPGYFEFRQEGGEKSHMHPIAYDYEIGGFIVADKQIELADFDPYSYNSYELFGLDDEGLEVPEVTKYGLLISPMGELIATPLLHSFAETNPDTVIETAIVMHSAYFSIESNPHNIDAENHGHMGFGAANREYGGVHVQVLGNCACMGPDPHSMYFEGQFEKGFAEYVLHNADTQPQRASLYAGLGHLAFLAEGRESARLKLF